MWSCVILPIQTGTAEKTGLVPQLSQVSELQGLLLSAFLVELQQNKASATSSAGANQCINSSATA